MTCRPAAGVRALLAVMALALLLVATTQLDRGSAAAAPRHLAQAPRAAKVMRPSIRPHGHDLYPLPAPPVQPEPCPPPPAPAGPPSPPLGPPAVSDSALPAPAPPPARHVGLATIAGKGIWLTVWPGQHVDARQIVDIVRRAQLHVIWLRTGSSQDGFYGGPLLTALVPLAHAVGISVVAWDFPTLSNPTLDAARAARALRAGADGFAADIESSAEGTYLEARRVASYLSLVRRDAGDRPVVAVVPRPIPYWLATYPYAAEAPYVDAFAPMVYWSCTEPGRAVLEAIRGLDHLRPVIPIGQDYNMASEGGRQGLPTGREIWRFLDVARRGGALGASLYDLESGGPAQLTALARFPWPALSP